MKSRLYSNHWKGKSYKFEWRIYKLPLQELHMVGWASTFVSRMMWKFIRMFISAHGSRQRLFYLCTWVHVSDKAQRDVINQDKILQINDLTAYMNQLQSKIDSASCKENEHNQKYNELQKDYCKLVDENERLDWKLMNIN